MFSATSLLIFNYGDKQNREWAQSHRIAPNMGRGTESGLCTQRPCAIPENAAALECPCAMIHHCSKQIFDLAINYSFYNVAAYCDCYTEWNILESYNSLVKYHIWDGRAQWSGREITRFTKVTFKPKDFCWSTQQIHPTWTCCEICIGKSRFQIAWIPIEKILPTEIRRTMVNVSTPQQ